MNTTLQSSAFPIKNIASLASIFSTRMLGLFIILPIFALYTQKLPGATTALIGIALGIYGLTQAIFQIPLAMLSDKIGRKPVILMGLLIFIIGSIVAALSSSIYGIILGRALQGAGAIGSTIIALTADLTTVENRTKAMAVIGMSIGASFAVAMVIGPILNTWIGLSGIFWTTAILGLISIGLLCAFVSSPPKVIFHRDHETASFKTLLLKPDLMRLNVGIFSLHALLTASFVVIPLLLIHAGNIEHHIWQFYLPIFAIAFLAVIPCIIIAEKFRCIKFMSSGAIFILCSTQISLWYFQSSLLAIGFILTCFFIAFTFLEALLPSLISKIAPTNLKGTAMGIYSTAQFLGIFVGGSLGGWLFHLYGFTGVFLLGTILTTFWFLIMITMPEPPHLSTLMVSIGHLTDTQAYKLTQQLKHIKGIHDAVITEDKIAYLKVDYREFNRDSLDIILGTCPR